MARICFPGIGGLPQGTAARAGLDAGGYAPGLKTSVNIMPAPAAEAASTGK